MAILLMVLFPENLISSINIGTINSLTEHDIETA